MSKILVTGSSGMIGTALVTRLLEDDHDLICVDRRPNRWVDSITERTINLDLTEADAYEQIPSDVDTVVHLAAHSRVRESVSNPDHGLANLEMTHRLMQFVRRTDIDNILFASSREVYSGTDGLIWEESSADLNDCANPYAASKIGGEAICRAFSACYGIDASICRISNVYGRYDVYDRVIPSFIKLALRGETLTVYGTNKVLDFVYIDDVVSGLISMLEAEDKVRGEAINLGSGRGTSLIQLAETISNLVPESVGYQVEGRRTGEVDRFIADISKAERLLDYRPTYSLYEGLVETVEWYQTSVELDEIG